MSKPRISQDVIEFAERIWTSALEKEGVKLTNVQVKQRINASKNYAHKIGDRKLQEVLTRVRRSVKEIGYDPDADPFNAPLSPWCDGLPWDDPDTNLLLFRLLYTFNTPLGVVMDDLEREYYEEMKGNTFGDLWGKPTLLLAKWVLKLQRHYDLDFKWLDLISMATTYASRELAAKVLGKDKPYTADWDAFLMFESSGAPDWHDQYKKAVELGAIPKYDLDIDLQYLEIKHPGFRDKFEVAMRKMETEV